VINKLDGQPKSPDHAHQFGAAVGGPIIKNKLFFLATMTVSAARRQTLYP
jgi:hypothetical protein